MLLLLRRSESCKKVKRRSEKKERRRVIGKMNQCRGRILRAKVDRAGEEPKETEMRGNKRGYKSRAQRQKEKHPTVV
jgi:hypothetical protein